MIKRQQYIDELNKFRDLKLVKILSGIRRCGKSTILEMYENELNDSGIDPDHIIKKSYTFQEDINEVSPIQMHKEITKQITDNGRYYILLDEVQEVEGWEITVNSLLENFNTDIYVTGSNSKLLSGEISTYLTGRYVSIPIYPLSFAEYQDFKKNKNLSSNQEIIEYMRTGGFPIVALCELDDNAKLQIVEGIYNSVITSDITRRHNVVNIDLFNRVVKFIIENVGKTFSAYTIAKFLKNEGRSLSKETIYNYIEWLEKAFIIYRCNRYDIQGKAILKTQEKFYLADTSLKYCMAGFNPTSVSASLENIVFFELKRNGYEVYIGKNGTREIDFIASKNESRIYIQVCRNIPHDSDREINNLTEIKDNFKKYVITLDEFSVGIVDGVEILYLPTFLLNTEKYL